MPLAADGTVRQSTCERGHREGLSTAARGPAVRKRATLAHAAELSRIARRWPNVARWICRGDLRSWTPHRSTPWGTPLSQGAPRQLRHDLPHLHIFMVGPGPEVLGGQAAAGPGRDHGGSDHRVLDVTACHFKAFRQGEEVDPVVQPGLRG